MNRLRILTTTLLLFFFFLIGFSGYSQDKLKSKTSEDQLLFPKGSPVPASNFTGKAWLNTFVTNDTIYTTVTGSVYFEAGARTNWHLHPGGQILVVTAGIGYHQIKGEPIQIIKKGDVIKCPPNVIHWHGASASNSMSHIYIGPNTEKGIVQWLQPVADEEYKATTN